MEASRATLLLNLATTLPLVGLIWFVQLVAYPLFAKVGPAEFGAYHEAHSRWITYVVGPLMVGELIASVALWMDAAVPRWLAVTASALAVSTWFFTLFVSVPKHVVLSSGFDAQAHAVLVATTWLRTGAWTLRGALLLIWMSGSHRA
jgi:hypothetical protein